MTVAMKREFKISNPDKVLFPESGITKSEIIAYYATIAPIMLRHVRNHPLVMQRYPDGIHGEAFYQKQIGDYFPQWIKHVNLTSEHHSKDYVVCDSRECLGYLANQAAFVIHMMTTTVKNVRVPDHIVFDLDPSRDDDFENVRKYAFVLRDLLGEIGLVPFVKTTGSRGLHVVTPISGKTDIDDVRAFAREIVDRLAQQFANDLTTEIRKAKRHGRIFLDVARNGFGQTAVAPYSVRAIEGAPIAMPVEWKELNARGFTSQTFNIHNFDRRIAKGDAWKDMPDLAKPVSAAMKRWAAMQ